MPVNLLNTIKLFVLLFLFLCVHMEAEVAGVIYFHLMLDLARECSSE